MKWQKKFLPMINIEALTDESRPKLIETDHMDGNVSELELACIAKMVQYFKPSRILEIGTFDGRTTVNMAINAPQANIVTMDLPSDDMFSTKYRIKKGDLTFINKPTSGARFLGTEYANQITQIYADSANYDYSTLANSIDFVFIDGAHSYEYVLNDTEVAFKLLRNGSGVLVWHDYEWKEVIYALNDYYQNDPRFKRMINIRDTTLAVLIVD